jgi:hypothetical protein
MQIVTKEGLGHFLKSSCARGARRKFEVEFVWKRGAELRGLGNGDMVEIRKREKQMLSKTFKE